MTKYIDCEAALAMLHKDEFGTPDERWHPESEIAEAILRLSAADVVPVVTCTDCKFWDRERISCEGLARCNTGESGVRYRNRNDFCSRGKRMDKDNNGKSES